MSFDFRKAPQFRLRRDFAAELNFSIWWDALPDAAAVRIRWGPVNRGSGFSESMPRHLGYFARDGRAYIVTKANHRLEVPMPGLFAEMIGTLTEVLSRQDPPQAPDFGSTAQIPLKNIVLHSIEMAYAWYVPVNDDIRRVLNDER